MCHLIFCVNIEFDIWWQFDRRIMNDMFPKNVLSPYFWSNFLLTVDLQLIPYRTKFRRTKVSADKIFRRTKFSTPSRNFDSFVQFLPDFCIEILDKIFDGQNVSSDKIFDTKLKFRHFCPTNFCPIRYIVCYVILLGNTFEIFDIFAISHRH